MKKVIPLFLFCFLTACPNYKEVKEDKPKNNKKKFIESSIIKDIQKHYHEYYGNELKLIKNDTDSILEISYHNIPKNLDEHVFPQISIHIPKERKSVLYGDLNNDNLEDIIVSVHTEGGGGGGNVWWNDIFVFFKKDDKYELLISKTNWKISGCNPGSVSIDKIEGNIIEGTTSCYAEDDYRCCPSLSYKIQLQIINNKIMVKNRKKI